MRTFAKFVVSTSIAASALLTALMAGGPSAIAADGNEEQRRARYEKCIALAQTDPEAARRDAAIAQDRTLAFPLYPRDQLQALKSLVQDAFG